MHYNCVNEALNCRKSVTPEAGMMGTMYVGSDRYPVVCVKVLSKTKVLVTEHATSFPTRTENDIEYYDGNLEELLERVLALPYWTKDCSDEELEEVANQIFKDHTYSRRKNGRWIKQGSPAWGTGSVHWGVGDFYLDPSF